MRSNLIRKIIGITGLSLCGYAVGVTFAWAIAAATVGLFMQFIWLLITAVLALFAVFKFVIPAVQGWVESAEALIPDNLGATVKGWFA